MIFLAILMSGYGIGYDGYEANKYYFQVNTPKADYGIVVTEKEIYCDVMVEK